MLSSGGKGGGAGVGGRGMGKEEVGGRPRASINDRDGNGTLMVFMVNGSGDAGGALLLLLLGVTPTIRTAEKKGGSEEERDREREGRRGER